MALHLNADQTSLREAARRFVAESSPMAELRRLRDSNDQVGFSRDLWKRFGEMGFTATAIPEEFGGLGLGQVEAGIILQEIGRNLTLSPFLVTAVGGVLALARGSDAQRQRWYPAIAAGDAVVAVACDEGPKHRLGGVTLRAETTANGFRLNGRKHFVLHGHIADMILVVARTFGTPGEHAGLALLAVDRDSRGLRAAPERLPDGSLAALIEFCDVDVPSHAVIGNPENSAAITTEVFDALYVGTAAEMLGVASAAADMTLSYLRERKQFGSPIGSFQALQHRAALLYCEMEVARAAVLKAQQLLDSRSAQAPKAAAVAKAMAGLAGTLAVQEGVQMHGGIGMTDEHNIGLTLKRLRVLCEAFGDTHCHAERLARMNQY